MAAVEIAPVVLAVLVDYLKRAGTAVLVDPIAVDQTAVVRKAVLVVAREVAGSWYTPSINSLLHFPPTLERKWVRGVTGL